MHFLIGAILLLLLTGFAVVYPPAVACAHLLFAARETPMVGAVFTQYARIPAFVLSALCFAGACSAYYRLWRTRNESLPARRMFIAATVAMSASIWVGLSTFSGESGLFRSGIEAAMSGTYGVVFMLAYHRNRAAMLLFLIPLALHLLLSLCIVTLPHSLFALLRPIGVSSLPEAGIGISEEGITKASAQFNNYVPLAFYGAVAVIVGIYLFFYQFNRLSHLAGLVLLGLGAWASYITVQRAIWIGILIGAVVLLRPVGPCWGRISNPAPTRIKAGVGAYVVSFLLVLYALFADTQNQSVIVLRDFFLSARQDSYRLAAATNSIDVLLDRPVFGVAGEVLSAVQLAGGTPHQSFYFYAIMYGIPVGVCVFILTWLAFTANFRRIITTARGPIFPENERRLAVALGWVVISMALSNNMSGGMISWMCLGFACLPWVYSPARSRAVSFARPIPGAVRDQRPSTLSSRSTVRTLRGQ